MGQSDSENPKSNVLPFARKGRTTIQLASEEQDPTEGRLRRPSEYADHLIKNWDNINLETGELDGQA